MCGMCIYSKTSLNRPTMASILNGPFREVVHLGSWNIVTMGDHWDPNQAIGIGEWSIWGGGRLGRFYWICCTFTVKPL